MPEVQPVRRDISYAQQLGGRRGIDAHQFVPGTRLTCVPNEVYGKTDEASGSQHTRYGVNRHGTPRYKCGACRKVFAFGGGADKRQQDTHHNREIFTSHFIKVLTVSADARTGSEAASLH